MEYNYGYPAMEKRTASRPTLSDYLRLAAIQYEMDKEEDEAADAQNAGAFHSVNSRLLNVFEREADHGEPYNDSGDRPEQDRTTW